MEEIVNFETAKLAKIKGFNWPVAYTYYSDGKLGEPQLEHPIIGLNDWNDNECDFSAPSQALLQRWLREEHQISVFPTMNNNVWCCSTYTSKGWEWEYQPDEPQSYEEVLEVGLFEALKLIKL